ncbi:uncharacterized protein LOC130780727 isoform X2 [Actinidia eriantha]|uniref:uncharacterized protein LOC130780727 isoform X2 n=1 Tax=Actinidia eriantha TaxID=165200 RepID=UPI002589C7A9|nr:uncharacterized protein LOC130780727 isoform X2 [Actinidia eriantha]
MLQVYCMSTLKKFPHAYGHSPCDDITLSSNLIVSNFHFIILFSFRTSTGTTNIAMLGIVHEELTEDNYEYWKVCLERFLISQGLWDVVSGTKVQPAENASDYEDWRRNALALHAIKLSCGPDIFYKFRKTTLANEAWEHLAPSHLTRPVVEERDDLEIINELGNTVQSLAAINGSKKLAKAMVKKNPNLVYIENDQNIYGHIPVIVAALYNRKHMVRYLYDKTPTDILSPEKGDHGATLLHCLITAEIYDVALQLLEQYPKLCLTKDRFGKYALRILAQKPSSFASGSKLVF